MKQIFLKWFRWDFGLAGVPVYCAVVLLANLDKEWATIAFIMLRQALVTFLLSSMLMGFVFRQIPQPNPWVAYFWGVAVPAFTVAFAGFVAHWYFTNQFRNILAPFCASAFLNALALTLARHGHESFGAQVKFVLRLVWKR